MESTAAGRPARQPWRPLRALLILSLSVAGVLHADQVATIPSGFFALTIAAGTGTSRTVSPLSLPLVGTGTATGQMLGRLTSVTANTLVNSAAGWAPGQLSAPAAPYLIRLTSGAAAGRTFLISTAVASTATTVTIDDDEASQVNLATLGIVTGASGDTYEILPCDTLSSIFGDPVSTGIVGGASSAAADIVRLFVFGAWRDYYYNTTSARWLRIGPNTNANNVPIRPDSGILYNRLGASPLVLTLLGRVPSIDRKALVRTSGVTFLGHDWPVGATLATSGIQQIPGWVASASSATADTVRFFVLGVPQDYYYTGSHWQKVGPNTVSDSVAIPPGSAVILNRLGASALSTTLTQARPYTL